MCGEARIAESYRFCVDTQVSSKRGIQVLASSIQILAAPGVQAAMCVLSAVRMVAGERATLGGEIQDAR